MRIAIAALGSRGDVQPMLALGKGLIAAGHCVTVIAGSNFQSWITGHAFRFISAMDIEAIMNSEKGLAWTQSSDNALKQVRLMRELMNEFGERMIDPIQTAAASADLLISSYTAQPIVQTTSEKTGVPYINALLQPQHATRSGPASLAALFPRRESVANLWLGALVEYFTWFAAGEVINRYRSQLQLPRHSARSFSRAVRDTRSLIGFSRHVVPPARDWPGNSVLTGYWFLDEETGWTPPRNFAAFLQDGPQPVYIGFGSMSAREPQKTFELIVAAVKRAELRAVVAAGWSDMPGHASPPEVCVIKSAPHQWLFPRVAAVVHHGGAGTTAAALRAGKPALIVPHMGDQPYWGRRVHELGVGVRPLPRHKLTVESLADRLRQLTRDARLRDNAAALGEKIRTERGVETAVAEIECPRLAPHLPC